MVRTFYAQRKLSLNEGSYMNQTSQKEEKFISIYKKTVDEVYQFIFLRVGFDESIAEDMTQDIFLDVFKGMNGFKGLCSERTWIFKIAKNKLYDFYRKRYNQTAQLVEIDNQLAEQLSDDKQDIEQYMEIVFETQAVCDSLNSLPPHYKIILLLKYIDNKSIKQIAEIVHRSPKAIESLLKRARNAFLEQYQSSQEKEELLK